MFGALAGRLSVTRFAPDGSTIVIVLSMRSADGPNVVSPTVFRATVAALEKADPVKSMIAGAVTSAIAWRSDPGPLSLILITVRYVGVRKVALGPAAGALEKPSVAVPARRLMPIVPLPVMPEIVTVRVVFPLPLTPTVPF